MIGNTVVLRVVAYKFQDFIVSPFSTQDNVHPDNHTCVFSSLVASSEKTDPDPLYLGSFHRILNENDISVSFFNQLVEKISLDTMID